jgi:hypothetical protein
VAGSSNTTPRAKATPSCEERNPRQRPFIISPDCGSWTPAPPPLARPNPSSQPIRPCPRKLVAAAVAAHDKGGDPPQPAPSHLRSCHQHTRRHRDAVYIRRKQLLTEAGLNEQFDEAARSRTYARHMLDSDAPLATIRSEAAKSRLGETMKLSEYFENAKGIGVLATTDASGQVNQALYAKPHFLNKEDDTTCSFIMTQRLSHDNLRHNPSASYLFIEEGEDYAGKRLSLTVMTEETDPEAIQAVRRRVAPTISDEDSRYLVHFHIEGVRPLVGSR